MRVTKKLLFVMLACLLALAPICLASSEPVVMSNDTNVKPINIINSDIYKFEQNVVIEGSTNGNAFAMGSAVTIKGKVDGDLFVLANTLTVEDSAVISGNIFVLANYVSMSGSANDIYAFAQGFDLVSGSTVKRDIRIYSSAVKLEGVINRDAYITTNDIKMPDDAKGLIKGDLNYTSGQELTLPKDAISGEIKYNKYEVKTPSTEEIISAYIVRFITTIIYAVVVILLATFFAPKFIEKASYTFTKRPFISAGIGILSIVLIPVLAIILLVTTRVLSYVSMAIIAVYALILSITLPIFSMIGGKFITDKLGTTSKGKFILFSILCAIGLWLLQIIPYVGGYISLFIYVVGLGVFLFSFFMRKDVSQIKDNNTK